MRAIVLACLASLSLAVPAAAHEVWIERDAGGPARIYFGEPAEPIPEGGDPQFPKLRAPTLIGETAPLVRRADHLEATPRASGDLRLVDGAIFAPWKNAAGAYEGAIFHAREGRVETRALLELEIVPVISGGDRFTVLYKGAPVAKASVTILDPERRSNSLVTGEDGIVTLPAEGAGRYILTVKHGVDGPHQLGGQTLARLHHVSTLSFVAP